MFQRVRKHISPATILAFMALVFAMTGGAFAASSNGGGGAGAKATASAVRTGSATTLATAAKSKTKPKAKAGPRGPAGPKGATGATGPAGPAGPTGPAGATGPGGPQGAPGTNGTNGENGAPGTPGKAGKEGSPWSVGGTLPAEKTETGAWSATAGEVQANLVGSISFPIQLTGALGENEVHYILARNNKEIHFTGTEEIERTQTACTGTAAEPSAEPGNLCVYEGTVLNLAAISGIEAVFILPAAQGSGNPTVGNGANKSGAVLFAGKEAGEPQAQAWGTWAVTEK